MGRLVNTSDLHNINQISKDEYGRLSYVMEKYVEEVVVKAPTVYVNDLIIPELEKIKAEIELMDFDFGDYYDNTDIIIEMVSKVIDKHISELKGE